MSRGEITKEFYKICKLNRIRICNNRFEDFKNLAKRIENKRKIEFKSERKTITIHYYLVPPAKYLLKSINLLLYLFRNFEVILLNLPDRE
jgi:hypothetical protein